MLFVMRIILKSFMIIFFHKSGLKISSSSISHSMCKLMEGSSRMKFYMQRPCIAKLICAKFHVYHIFTSRGIKSQTLIFFHATIFLSNFTSCYLDENGSWNFSLLLCLIEHNKLYQMAKFCFPRQNITRDLCLLVIP